MSILDGLLAKLPPDSYDAAFVLVQKAQLYVQAGEYAKAIEPMERGVRLSDSKTSSTYFEDRQSKELYFFLFQLYFQEARATARIPP